MLWISLKWKTSTQYIQSWVLLRMPPKTHVVSVRSFIFQQGDLISRSVIKTKQNWQKKKNRMRRADLGNEEFSDIHLKFHKNNWSESKK